MKSKKTGRPKMPKGKKKVAVTVMLRADVAAAFKKLDDKNRFVEEVLRARPEISRMLKHS